MVQYQPGMLEEGSVFIGNCLLGGFIIWEIAGIVSLFVSYACNRLMVQYQPGMLEEGSIFIGYCLLGRAQNLGKSNVSLFVCELPVSGIRVF